MIEEERNHKNDFYNQKQAEMDHQLGTQYYRIFTELSGNHFRFWELSWDEFKAVMSSQRVNESEAHRWSVSVGFLTVNWNQITVNHF